MMPLLIAAAEAYSASQKSAAPAAPGVSGQGTIAPGGIFVGSKVVGSGSAATTATDAAIPAIASTPGVTAGTGAAAGVAPWLQSPWVVLAAVALGVGLILALLPRPRRRET